MKRDLLLQKDYLNRISTERVVAADHIPRIILTTNGARTANTVFESLRS